MGSPLGVHVLMESRTKPVDKTDLAVVLSVSPTGRSCRVQRDSNNRKFLLNRSKLVRDPAFSDDDGTRYGGGMVSSMPNCGPRWSTGSVPRNQGTKEPVLEVYPSVQTSW